jgi:hypothetical protein
MNGQIGRLVRTNHNEVTLCYAQIGDHTEPSTAIFGDLEEFATPFQVVDTVDWFVITHANNGTQGEHTEVKSLERRETLIIACTASPQCFAGIQKRPLVEDGMDVVDRSEVCVDEAATLRVPIPAGNLCVTYGESLRLCRSEVRIVQGRQQSGCVSLLWVCSAMDLRETCHGRGAAIKLCASSVCVYARDFLLAQCPWRNTIWRWRLDITGIREMAACRSVADIGTCSGIIGRSILVLLQASSQVLQTALELLDILPRHRRIGCCLALILALDVTACQVSAGT